MSLTRRGFLQLLGIGAAAVAVETAIKPIPLFGSDEEEMLVRPPDQFMGGHFIVQRKHFVEKIPEDDPVWNKYNRDGGVFPVARITRHRVPGGGSLESLQKFELRHECEFPDGVDPHAVFYKASHELREKFLRMSHANLANVPSELRAGSAVLVTVAESPLVATPKGWGSQRGFDVATIYRQGVRYLGPDGKLEGLDTFNVYSTNGEFPIHVPRDIDMAMMMRLDREIMSQPELLRQPVRAWGRAASKARSLYRPDGSRV